MSSVTGSISSQIITQPTQQVVVDSERTYEVLDLQDPSTKATTSGWKYVAYRAACAAVLILWLPLKIVFFIPNMVSYISNYSLKHEVQKARLEALREGLHIQLSAHTKDDQTISKPFIKWSPRSLVAICKAQYTPSEAISKASRSLEIYNFVFLVKEIQNMITDGGDPESIRAKIHEAMSTNIYQQLKKKEYNPAVEFLQILALKELSVDGEHALKNYGKKVLGPLNTDSFSWGELASLMDGPVGATFAYKKNGLGSKILFSLANPVTALNNLKSELLPMQFNAYNGNPNMRSEDFSYKGKKMQSYYGPNPTGDKLYSDGVLVYMDKLNAGGVKVHELRHNFQSIQKHHEAVRNFEMMRYENDHPESMRLLNISFDSEAMEMTPNFTQFITPSEFMHLYAKYIMAETGLGDSSPSIADIEPTAHKKILSERRHDNGFYVGGQTISDDQFKDAFHRANLAFTDLYKDGQNKHWANLEKTPEGKQRLGRVMQLGTHAMISMGAVTKSLTEIHNPKDVQRLLDKKLDDDLAASRVTGACKQDIDRGIVENITLRLFFRLLENYAPLTKDEVYSIAGAVIGRARLVEDRLIMWSRYEILSDLLKFVDDQENVQILSNHLKAYVESDSRLPTMTSSGL